MAATRSPPPSSSSSVSSSSSSFSHSRASRYLRRPSIFSAYVFVLLVFSGLLFLFYHAHIALVDQRSSSFPHGSAYPVANEEQLWGLSFGYGFRPCLEATSKYKDPQIWDRYLTIRSNGGLNQMRTGIADMVAVARIINATLIIPQLDKKSFWQDTSSFSDIFDEAHFIKFLEGDVHILRELPPHLQTAPRARKHFTSWSGLSYYVEVSHLWKDYKVIHAPKSDSRLANNDLPLDIQRLRCRAFYRALRFSAPIENLGKKLVERLRSHGRYIALHLRYEKDMLSFTGCTHGLNSTEAEELRILRERTSHWKLKIINSTEQRLEGNCPLTPKEVGMFLEAMGYPQSTWIYVAAGEIFGGDKYLLDLRSRFPNLIFKEKLATTEELSMFANHASKSAALDYAISVESDVFVPSYSGNMARAVEGHRRFLGHWKTISPDRKGLVELFDLLAEGKLKEGSALSSRITQMHKLRQGAPRRRYGPQPGMKGRNRLRTEESFYENPFPECICRMVKH